jgi:hypothetical protein
VVYTPKGVVPHAALLRQAFAHCAISLHAKPLRALDHVSVPVWLTILSDQLPIVATVGRYPTFQLIGRSPLHRHITAFVPGVATGHAMRY